MTVETYGVDPKGFDWVMLRGFNAQATSDYKDGLRQATSGYTLFRSEPYALDRIEVLRGPSSVLYGQGDAGGVINRVSKLPSATPHYEAELEYGSFQRKQAAVDLTGPATEDGTLMYRIIGVARDANTQFTYPNGDRISDDRLFLAPSLTWAPSAATRFTLLTEYLRDRSGGTIGTVTVNGKPPICATAIPISIATTRTRRASGICSSIVSTTRCRCGRTCATGGSIRSWTTCSWPA